MDLDIAPKVEYIPNEGHGKTISSSFQEILCPSLITSVSKPKTSLSKMADETPSGDSEQLTIRIKDGVSSYRGEQDIAISFSPKYIMILYD